jgi:hypothetical protein
MIQFLDLLYMQKAPRVDMLDCFHQMQSEEEQHCQELHPYLDEAVVEDHSEELAGDGGVDGGGRPDYVPHRQLHAWAGERVVAGRELAQGGRRRRRGARRLRRW